MLVDRRGEIEHVFVGDASQLNLPEIGRLRAGRGRFRGLRLVHTHLRNEPLTRDDLVDLAMLRLDLVAAIGLLPGRAAGATCTSRTCCRRPRAGSRGGSCRRSRSTGARWTSPRSSRRSKRSSSAPRRRRSRPTRATAPCWWSST